MPFISVEEYEKLLICVKEKKAAELQVKILERRVTQLENKIMTFQKRNPYEERI